jgi:hypothetical protein
MAMKAIAKSATRPSTIIHSHILFELVVLLVCVVSAGRLVCVVVVVVVVDVVFLVVCGDDGGCDVPELAFWASAGTTNPAHARLSTSRHALKPLNNRQDFIRIPLSG